MVSELVHVEEVGNLLQARHTPDLWKQEVNASLQGDNAAQEGLGRAVEKILSELVPKPAPQEQAWEDIWRERKRWFHIPNTNHYQHPQCECDQLCLSTPARPLRDEAKGRCPSCGGPQWEVRQTEAGWFRATIDVWPFRWIRGLVIETEQSNAVMVSLKPLLNSEARNPLTGWTYTSQPESPATCGVFVTNIIRKYGRPKAANSVQPAKEKVKFEFSDDDDKRVWALQ